MTPIIYGFTGTKHGMTQAQLAEVAQLLHTIQITRLHHGMCMGADIEVNTLAVLMKIKTEGHPSTVAKTSRSCELDKIHNPYPPLERDKHIVMAGVDGLIATPKTAIEQLRSGTWATVRYARQMNRKIVLVMPDGNIRLESNEKLAL